MTAFEYLAAFISIVAGLSVAQTLTGVVRLIHGRRTMKADVLHLLWTASLLLWLILFWWFSFSLENVSGWSVGHLLFVLLYAALIYLLLALLYPSDLPADFNTANHLDSNRQWFFGALLTLGVVELFDTLLKEGAGIIAPGVEDNIFGGTWWYPIFMLVWLGGSLIALRSSNRRFHLVFAAAFLLLAAAYLASQPTLEAISGNG
jgi:Ca2+/Na+ antiporter